MMPTPGKTFERLASVSAVLGGLLLATALPVQAAQTELEQDLEQMLAWFGGRFDNHEQARGDEQDEVEEPHGRIHSIFAPVELPSVGEHIFYVQQYSDGDPTQIYRQRLYSFRINLEHAGVELVIYAPPDPAAVVDAHLDPTKLAGLTLENLRSYPGCEVHWTRHGRGTEDDHFTGVVPKGACQVKSTRSGRTLIIMDDLRLDAEQIWIQDRAVDPDGEWVYGHKGGVPHKLHRVRWFDCWAAAPKEGDDEGDDWDLWRPIHLHDQGGEYPLVPPNDDAELAQKADRTRYTVKLFQPTYRGERSVPVVELAIYEAGQERSIAYSWADPSSSRIGINLRKLQVGCTLDPDRLW